MSLNKTSCFTPKTPRPHTPAGGVLNRSPLLCLSVSAVLPFTAGHDFHTGQGTGSSASSLRGSIFFWKLGHAARHEAPEICSSNRIGQTIVRPARLGSVVTASSGTSTHLLSR